MKAESANPPDSCTSVTRMCRQEQKINQEEAAERCGLHRRCYCGIERGMRNVSLVNIERVAKGLKRSLPELFSRI
jgi:transcriptional regulator with XRE-family HTH domain